MTDPKYPTVKSPIADLCERMDTLRLRYNLVFNPKDAPAAPPFIPMADTIVRGLTDSDKAAVNVARAVVGFDQLARAEFWGTPLGRLLFSAGGFPTETCSQTVAANVLSCSRQWVSAMLADGKLTPGDWKSVYVDEVRAILADRARRVEGLKNLVD